MTERDDRNVWFANFRPSSCLALTGLSLIFYLYRL